MTWPSSHAPATRGYMRDRIDDELKRSGTIDSRITNCINDAITIYQPHRFRFSESRTALAFNTVVAQEFYTSADNPAIASLYLFDYLVIAIGTAQSELTRRPPKDLETLSQAGTQQGQPTDYSYYNETLRLYPVPSAVYPIVVGGHMKIAAPATDDEAGNRWMIDGERLIRCRAKYELAVHNLNDPDLAARMNPETGAAADAFSELKRDANKITATGRVRPTQF